jgi:ribose transport system permease protein
VSDVAARIRSSSGAARALALAVLLFAVGWVHTSGFASATNVRQLLVFSAFIGFAALGQTLVVIAGGLDLSIPWLISFGGIEAATLAAAGVNGLVAVGIVVAIGAVIGSVNGLGVTVFGVPPIVMTLGVGGLVQAYLLSVGLLKTTGNQVPHVARSLADGRVGPVPVVALVWLALAMMIALVLTRTRFGRSLYATGENEDVAYLSGISTSWVRFASYTISGAASAFAGVLIAGYVGATYLEIGSPYLFASIAAIVVGGVSVLGGRGSYFGAVAGALTLTVLNSLLPLFRLDTASLDIVYGVVILAGVAVSGVGTGRTKR